MTAMTTFVSSAEAAYIGEVSDRDVNRAIDERIVPSPLVRLDGGRGISRLAAACISFYVDLDTVFTASLRKQLLATMTERVVEAGALERGLALDLAVFGGESYLFFEVKTPKTEMRVDFQRYLSAAKARADKVDAALAAISTSEDVLGGMPVFRGTRVPIDTILASIDKGIDFQRLQDSYPVVTEELVEAARIYAQVRPRRGRPRRIAEMHPDWKLISSEIIDPVP